MNKQHICPGGRCQGKNVLKPHLKQTWCIGTLDSRFLARMEVLLALYKLPYDPNYPVICYDERPSFLIGETVAPLTMRMVGFAENIMRMRSWAPALCWR